MNNIIQDNYFREDSGHVENCRMENFKITTKSIEQFIYDFIAMQHPPDHDLDMIISNNIRTLYLENFE